MYHLVHLEWMARSYVEAEAVARPAPAVVWELVGDARQLLREAAVERERAPGAAVLRRPAARHERTRPSAARTHAAERCANARGRALRERTRPSAARTHATERCANAAVYTFCVVHQV